MIKETISFILIFIISIILKLFLFILTPTIAFVIVLCRLYIGPIIIKTGLFFLLYNYVLIKTFNNELIPLNIIQSLSIVILINILNKSYIHNKNISFDIIYRSVKICTGFIRKPLAILIKRLWRK